jgi:hypothetical protein
MTSIFNSVTEIDEDVNLSDKKELINKKCTDICKELEILPLCDISNYIKNIKIPNRIKKYYLNLNVKETITYVKI